MAEFERRVLVEQLRGESGREEYDVHFRGEEVNRWYSLS